MYPTLLKLSRAVFKWPPLPASPACKHELVSRMGSEWKLKNLIETGTFEGDMVEAQRENFDRIATIELADALYQSATERFAAFQQITVIQGDSGLRLAEAMKLFQCPVLFWLDAHYSGGVTASGDEESPILKELLLIAARDNNEDVILIDDARLFGWRRGYPSLRRLRKFVAKHLPTYCVKIESDVVCLTPKNRPT